MQSRSEKNCRARNCGEKSASILYYDRRHSTSVGCRLFCRPILLGRCRFCSFFKLLSYRHTAKAKAVVAELRTIKLKEAAKKVEDGIEETLTYCDFPGEHWTRIRTNNVIERLNREIRRRTRVVGTFPDGNSALMLVCARLRHVAGTQWGNKKYMNMKHLEAALAEADLAG